LASSPRYQFIAGGIGVTPILTMIEAAEARGADWHLLYGGRERASMGFLNELEAYGPKVTIVPQDERGVLDLENAIGTPRADTLVYCCGPEGLLNAVESMCQPWPEGSLHIERFSAKSAGTPAADTPGSFEVVCQRSGITLTVGVDQTIFEVAEEAGLDLLGACMEGVCGTCEVEVVEGIPDHRDSVLSDAEQTAGDAMMICVSRSRSERLVLDI
jgi:ferredoxin-NADP reductase